MMEFGVWLRENRKRRNLTLQQLAVLAWTSKSYVSELEAGLCQPTITTLFKFAKAFDMKLSEVILEMESA